jgi:hypothetical protein
MPKKNEARKLVKETFPHQAERDEARHEQFEKFEPAARGDAGDDAEHVTRVGQAVDTRKNGVARCTG